MPDNHSYSRALPDDAEVGSWAAADGWPVRVLRLRPVGRARGAILFLGGRADFFEKYIESLVHWREQGWDVSAFDWRGQGGSGRFADDPMAGHADSFSTWVDDLAGFVTHWRALVAGPHMLIGHSMGGHLLLRYLTDHDPSLAGAVLSAPMIAFHAPLPAKLVRRLAVARVQDGRGRQYAWGQSARPAAGQRLRQRRLTSDRARYADELWWQANHPELALGGTTWGWINAAYASTDRLLRPDGLEGVKVPVLLIGAKKDRVVDTAEAVSAISRIPDHEIALYPGAHELLRERDDIRRPVWQRIETFMEERCRC